MSESEAQYHSSIVGIARCTNIINNNVAASLRKWLQSWQNSFPKSSTVDSFDVESFVVNHDTPLKVELSFLQALSYVHFGRCKRYFCVTFAFITGKILNFQ